MIQRAGLPYLEKLALVAIRPVERPERILKDVNRGRSRHV